MYLLWQQQYRLKNKIRDFSSNCKENYTSLKKKYSSFMTVFVIFMYPLVSERKHLSKSYNFRKICGGSEAESPKPSTFVCRGSHLS
jgi:hypothetical protein